MLSANNLTITGRVWEHGGVIHVQDSLLSKNSGCARGRVDDDPFALACTG